jgi:7-cyano-7-deazaguanine synthase in queuosine biosynthesis
MPERLFYCGTEPPHDDGKAYYLRLAGAAPNVNRRLEDIEKRMVSEIPDHLCDLLDIATYVFVADRMVGRGGKTLPNMGREWHRSFRFSIAVREPDRWNRPEIKAALQDLVGFLSGDDYRFQFLKSDEVPAYPRHLPLGGGDVTPKRFDQVLLFSGGLDSLAGALEELSLTRDRIVLVSHRSSPMVFSRQRSLANELADQFDGRTLHVPVEITMTEELREVEFTQRTRTFLFFALGCVVAEMMGCARIRFFENGIMSFNLPIAAQIVGSRATRSTHPGALRQMMDFANEVLGHKFVVENPFIWLTKAEVVRVIERHGQSSLIANSISCTHVRKTGPQAHCGKCAQCLHRRLAVLSAKLSACDKEGDYEVDLLIGERMGGDSRSMALNLVSNALDYPRLSLSGFLSRYGGEVMSAAKAFSDARIENTVTRIYELHCRYGNEVGEVVDDAIRQYAPQIREHSLARDCLLRALIGNQTNLDRTPLGEVFAGESGSGTQGEGDARDFRRTSRIHLALDTDRERVVIDGLGVVGTRAQFEIVSILVRQHQTDIQAGIGPANRASVTKEELMEELNMDSEPALVRRISDFRENLSSLVLAKWGIQLSRHAVIETKSGKGYRLNPDVIIIDLRELI